MCLCTCACMHGLKRKMLRQTPPERASRCSYRGCNAADGSGGAKHAPTCVPLCTLREDDVLAEQLTRNVQFFGEEPQQRIADAFVVIVGLGGVGSHAAHMLLRSGVGRLRLIDFDQVGASMTPELAATGTEGGLKTLMVKMLTGR